MADQASDQIPDQTMDQDGDGDVDHERALLRSTLQHWQTTQQQILPQLGSPPLIDEERPELTPLQLPSTFTSDERQRRGLNNDAQIEIQLRRDNALNTLSNLRDIIHEYNHTVTEKRVDPSSQKIGTRVQAQLAEIKSRMEALMR